MGTFLNKIWRLVFGYGFLLVVLVAGLTIGFPFVVTLGVGLGILPASGFPFPHRPFLITALISVPITAAVGARWLCFPWPWLDARLARLRLQLLRSKRQFLLRCIGIFVAIPLFAFVLCPWSMLWLALETSRDYLHLPDEWPIYQFPTAMLVGIIWLAVVLGRLCPQPGRVRRFVLRCRKVFIDWILEPANPKAARRERDRLRRDCSKL